MKYVSKRNLRTLTLDLACVIIGFTCLYFYNKYNFNPYFKNEIFFPLLMSGATVAAIVFIYLFPLKINEDKNIYVNKKAILPFCVVEILFLICVFIFDSIFKINNYTVGNFNKLYILLFQLGVSLTIFICYFFKISLKNFNWNISFKSIILVIVSYIVYKLFPNLISISQGMVQIADIFNGGLLFKIIINTIFTSAYPGFFEEVLYRGFLVSGLKGLGLADEKCNIIQAIIFGISHVMSFGIASWMFLLSTSTQAMLGYVLGKIYFKTKSLVPCILLHGLLNAA